MTINLQSRVDQIDVKVEQIRRMIARASETDPELQAGLATAEPLGSVQRKIDMTASACEEVEHAVRDFIRYGSK